MPAPQQAAVIDDAVVLDLIARRLNHATLGVGPEVRVLLPSEGRRFDEANDRCVQIVACSVDGESRHLASPTQQDAGAAVVVTINACAGEEDTKRDRSALERVIARVRDAFRPDRAVLHDSGGGHTLQIDRVVAQTDPSDDPDELRVGAVRLEGHVRRAEPSFDPLADAGPRPAFWEI